MKTIYKYDLPIDDSLIIKMPMEARILSVQLQRGNPVLWAIVDTDNPIITRQFHVFATGAILKDVEEAINTNMLDHLATVQDGPLVWHVFENTLSF